MTDFVSTVNGLITKATGAVGSGVQVFDGAPDAVPSAGVCYVVIGAALSQPTSSSNPLVQYLGGDHSFEDTYDIAGYVHVESGDSSIAWCRNQVVTAWFAFRNAVQLDKQLGGAMTGGDWIEPGTWAYQQTSDEDLNDPDTQGRFAHIDFTFNVTTLVQP